MGGGGGGGSSETLAQVQDQINNTELWNYYQDSYKPFVDKYIAQTENSTSNKVEQAQVTGQVNADVMKAATAATEHQQPGQPNAVNVTRQLTPIAATGANAQTAAENKLRTRQLGQLQNIVNIGRGQATQAIEGQGQIAEQSVRKSLNDTEAELRTQGTWESAAGSAAGAAAGLYGRSLNKQPDNTDITGANNFDPNAAAKTTKASNQYGASLM